MEKEQKKRKGRLLPKTPDDAAAAKSKVSVDVSISQGSEDHNTPRDTINTFDDNNNNNNTGKVRMEDSHHPPNADDFQLSGMWRLLPRLF